MSSKSNTNPMGTRTWCSQCNLPHTPDDLEVGYCTNCGKPTPREEMTIKAAHRRDMTRTFKLSRRIGETEAAFRRRVDASRR